MNTYAAFMMGGDVIITLTNGEKQIGRIIDVTDEEIVLKSTKTVVIMKHVIATIEGC